MRCSFEKTDSHGNRWGKPWTVKFTKYILSDSQTMKTCSSHCWYHTVCSVPYFVLLSGARTKNFFLLWLFQLIQFFPRLNYSFLIPVSELCKAGGRDKECTVVPLQHVASAVSHHSWCLFATLFLLYLTTGDSRRNRASQEGLLFCFSLHEWVKVGEEQHWTVEGV